MSFRRTGSASATVRAFRERGLQFPRRLYTGPQRGELAWGEPLFCRVLHTLCTTHATPAPSSTAGPAPARRWTARRAPWSKRESSGMRCCL